MLRQPISWRWHLALGVASVLALLAGYTFLSWQRQRSNSEDRIIPSWSQIYREGLLETITPVVAIARMAMVAIARTSVNPSSSRTRRSRVRRITRTPPRSRSRSRAVRSPA